MSIDPRQVAQSLQSELEKVVFGQQEIIQGVLVALMSGGHVLLEGVPGLAKTMLVKSLGLALQCNFSRIQFTPDLMPADITGVSIYDAQKGAFELRRGPLFADLVLADEVNRTPAKTQAALLEAMQERQISIDGQTHVLSPLFTVVATQNPIENEGTYPLPEAQLDRFLVKMVLDYPSEADERAMLKAMHALRENSVDPTTQIRPLIRPEELLELRRHTQATRVDDSMLDYILGLVRGSRTMPTFSLGCSPRSAVMLLNASKALSALRGKDFVSPDEVQAMALPVLRHRVQLTPEAEIEGLKADDCLRKLITQVAIPR